MHTLQKDIRILLVQIRKDEVMRDHELSCFLRNGGFSGHQLISHDLVEGPVFSAALDGVDGLIIGGSGDWSVLDDFPNKESLEHLLMAALRKKVPTLGACFGGQLMAEVYGGTVIQDKPNQEVGTVVIARKRGTDDDALIGRLPGLFKAQAGHNDRIKSLPRRARLLASSDKCPVQAFVMKGTPLYGLQFHPELTKQDLLIRLEHYKKDYVDDPSEVDEVIAGLEDTPESAGLVRDWMRNIVLPNVYANTPALT